MNEVAKTAPPPHRPQGQERHRKMKFNITEEIKTLKRSEEVFQRTSAICEELQKNCSPQRGGEIQTRLFSLSEKMSDLRIAFSENNFETYFSLKADLDEMYEELDWLLANTKTIVRPMGDAVQIISNETLPCGVGVLTVPCDDYKTYKSLPKAVAFDEREYGLSGWDSDKCVGYFRSDRRVAHAL